MSAESSKAAEQALLDHVKAAKFPYWEETIHLFVGGSALHGAKVQGYDDLDIYGVYVEPPEKILGVDSYEHFVWSTGNLESKNTADDVDITLYGLNKWAHLACKGNPSILHGLQELGFIPESKTFPYESHYNEAYRAERVRLGYEKAEL